MCYFEFVLFMIQNIVNCSLQCLRRGWPCCSSVALLWTPLTDQSYLCQQNSLAFGHFWSVTYSILLIALLNKQNGYPGFDLPRNWRKHCVTWKYMFNNQYLLCSITEPFIIKRHTYTTHLSRGLPVRFLIQVIMLQYKKCLKSCDARLFLDLILQIEINFEIHMYRKK